MFYSIFTMNKTWIANANKLKCSYLESGITQQMGLGINNNRQTCENCAEYGLQINDLIDNE